MRVKLIHTVIAEDEYGHDVWLDATELYHLEQRLPSGAMVVSDLMGVMYRLNPPAIREAVVFS